MTYTNLPVQLTSFIGRERELGEVKYLLSTSRLVTLTGASGCGNGKRVKWSLIDINRIVDGKVGEHWAEVDTMGLMQQLGLVPPPSGH